MIKTLIFLPLLILSISAQPLVIDVPEMVYYGHWPFEVQVTYENTNAEAVIFEGDVWVGGPAWGGENYSYSFSDNSIIYDTYCNRIGCTFYWRGNVEPEDWATFTLPTFSSLQLGTYNLVHTNIEVEGEVLSAEKTITLIEGDFPASGEFHADLDKGKFWHRGELKGLELTLVSPTTTQFFGEPMTSDCEIKGLPGGFTSHYNRTREKYLWHVYLPEDAPLGRCTISGTVNMNNGESFDASYKFVVKK